MRYGPGMTMALGVLAFALAGCQQPAAGRPGTGVEPAAFGSGAPGGALDPEDRMLVNAAAQHALETAPDGTPVGWTNPSSGHSGAVMPMRSYQTGDGLRCRVFRQTIAGDGQLQRSAGTACRQADGSWKVVDS
ncbi:MAG: RT0821/Lpp0805 family surface protein [Dongiaceae bacterium]